MHVTNVFCHLISMCGIGYIRPLRSSLSLITCSCLLENMLCIYSLMSVYCAAGVSIPSKHAPKQFYHMIVSLLFSTNSTTICILDTFLCPFSTGFLSTLPAPLGSSFHEMVALDCEMVSRSNSLVKK